MAPSYPGISDSPTLDDWDPPFPIDLRRVRPWTRILGGVPRRRPRRSSTRGGAGPVAVAVRLDDVDSDRAARRASRSPTSRDRSRSVFARASIPCHRACRARCARGRDRGLARRHRLRRLFVYFSFFLVVSALLLAALFFKLGIEQRAREVGLLRAVGFDPARGPPSVPERGVDPRGRRQRLGVVGAWLRVAADARPAYLVGRRRRHDRADAACLAGIARRPAPPAALSPRLAASGGRYAV